MALTRVYLGFGANLGEPRATLERALEALARADVAPTRRAPLYSTRPLGPEGQPRYLNTVIEADTALAPRALLDALKRIERELGRTPSERWGPRVIDLDILLYGERALDEPDLTIPHAQLAARRFVLAPLARLCPALVVPGLGRSVSALLDALPPDLDPPTIVEP